MEYTDEQLKKLIADATNGMFTKEELDKQVTMEADRRVETGITKGIATQKAKWEAELADKANLTATELADKAMAQKMLEIGEQEKSLSVRSNKLDAVSKLTSANIPKDYYANFIDSLVVGDAEKTNASIDGFISMYDKTRADIESKIKAEFTKVPPPNNSQQGGTDVTKESFGKMGYADKMKYKESNPDTYKQFMSK